MFYTPSNVYPYDSICLSLTAASSSSYEEKLLKKSANKSKRDRSDSNSLDFPRDDQSTSNGHIIIDKKSERIKTSSSSSTSSSSDQGSKENKSNKKDKEKEDISKVSKKASNKKKSKEEK